MVSLLLKELISWLSNNMLLEGDSVQEKNDKCAEQSER
jgi:hypothetical protein